MSKEKKPVAKHRIPKKPNFERDRCVRKEHVDFHITEKSKNATAMPVDYTFHRYREIKETATEFASRGRLGIINISENKKFLSQSFWLSSNLIRDIKNIDNMIESVIEYPDRLGFVDLSHNQIKVIDAGLLKFKNLKVLYLHDNKISEMEEIFKLRELTKLQHLTLFGNPFYEKTRLGNIRTVVKNILPQIKKLDYNRLAGIETELPVGAHVLRFLEKKEGRVPSYIPCMGSNERKSGKTHSRPKEKKEKAAAEYKNKKAHKISNKKDVKDDVSNIEVECLCSTHECS